MSLPETKHRSDAGADEALRAAAAEEAKVDRDLIVAVCGGDRAALARLYDRHSPQLLAVACRVLQNRRDAEDVVHDVFVEAWQKAKSYDSARGTVRSWLLLRARSRAIDRIRALATLRERVRDAAPKGDIEPQDTDNMPLYLDQERARHAVERLPEAQRNVVLLSYFEGLTHREIAQSCGIPEGTVKSRMSAAISVLRRVFQPSQGGA